MHLSPACSQFMNHLGLTGPRLQPDALFLYILPDFVSTVPIGYDSYIRDLQNINKFLRIYSVAQHICVLQLCYDEGRNEVRSPNLVHFDQGFEGLFDYNILKIKNILTFSKSNLSSSKLKVEYI